MSTGKLSAKQATFSINNLFTALFSVFLNTNFEIEKNQSWHENWFYSLLYPVLYFTICIGSYCNGSFKESTRLLGRPQPQMYPPVALN